MIHPHLHQMTPTHSTDVPRPCEDTDFLFFPPHPLYTQGLCRLAFLFAHAAIPCVRGQGDPLLVVIGRGLTTMV